MPTITFTPDELYELIGQKINDEQLEKYLACAKAEFESRLTNEITVKFNDTNQPYLWGVEGLARLIKQLMGKTVSEAKAEKPKEKVVCDRKLSGTRPYIASFTAKGKKIDEQLLKQLIQLQEKLAENFGRKRQKLSIGVYPLRNISFPVNYRAAEPTEKFTPLDFHQPVTLKEALEKHPKGKEYGALIKKEKLYPVLSDSKRNILSLIPIINSEQTGRLAAGDDSLFFDTTGTDEEAVNLTANIFACALIDRGFSIQAITIEYPGRKVITPKLESKKVKFDEKEAEILGIKLKTEEIKKALMRIGSKYQNGIVTIPCYRNDVMHAVDIVEDLAIAYGYDKLTPLQMRSYTEGGTSDSQQKIDLHRELWTGLGYQEILSAMLTNKELLYDKMLITDSGTIELQNPVSRNYSCVRSWLLPILLDVLSKNKHIEYPHKIFEQGRITTPRGDEEHIAAAISHATATFTEARQAVETILKNSGVSYTIQEYESGSFIPGRAACVIVNNKQAGFIGEIHPAVLEKFGIQTPVAGCEINLSLLCQQ